MLLVNNINLFRRQVVLPNLSTRNANLPTIIVTRILHSRSWLFKRWMMLFMGLSG